MHGKEFLMDTLRTFFAISTLSTIAILVLGLMFVPGQPIGQGYEAFATPLIFGLVGSVPNLVMYSKRELSVKELLIRKVVQLILVEVLVLYTAFGDAKDMWDDYTLIAAVAVSIFLIYLIVTAISWCQNYLEAKRLTEDLMKFQNR
ncbi:MAG: DUF3021 family protein [Lachnospiraceae bacterium]|nr:DUF3021 family protein [Lachnospiraceae bacterium]